MYTVGPDFSAIAVNPAGIGGFWKSEFTASVGLNFSNYTGRFDDTSTLRSGNFNQLRLPNLGFVLATTQSNNRWNTSNWAIGINRTGEYDKDIQFAGNTLGSITDSWRENAQGVNPDDLNGFEEGLAYTSGAIYDFENDNTYESDYQLNAVYPLYKEEKASVVGGKSELFIGYGANLNQKLLIGASLNMPIVNATVNRFYREQDLTDDAIPFFRELKYNSYVNTSGIGFNGKFGVILKPSK